MSQTRSNLRLSDVRKVFRLVGELRELGADPQGWRPHLLLPPGEDHRARIWSSHPKSTFAPAKRRACSASSTSAGSGTATKQPLQINTERYETPEAFWVALCRPETGSTSDEHLVPVRPKQAVRGGSSFILSQYPLTHLGTVDQLGLHRYDTHHPFGSVDHKLVRLFHLELGRLWRTDALRKAADAAIRICRRDSCKPSKG